MEIFKIDAELLKKLFIAGAANLDANKEWINELNVFPVPDGDTGSNMTMTIMSAVSELQKLEEPSMAAIAKAISSGALRGARGNSGVILSQLIRGFAKEIEDKTELRTRELIIASKRAVSTAYKAVMKPKEGTILTVASGVSEKAIELKGVKDIGDFLSQIIEYGDQVLEKTPDLLPVLKEAGVVDSGGQGLMVVLKGVYDCLMGKEIDYSAIKQASPGTVVKKAGRSKEKISTDDIKFGYCTEFIVLLQKPVEDEKVDDFKDFLSGIGDSIVCVADDDYIKVHVHTNDPGLALQRGLKYGELTNLKIDNMREEHRETLFDRETYDAAYASAENDPSEEKEPPKKYGFISVSSGDGMTTICQDLGVDFIIKGGQTMNPSTDDFIQAIKAVNADNIYIFPNNGNVIMAATQAAEMEENKNIFVVRTRSLPECFSSLIAFDPENDPNTNLYSMVEAIKKVETGEVTYAVRDTVMNDVSVKKNDIMGIADNKILAVSKDIKKTVKELVSKMVNDDSELITLYYGKDVNEEDAESLVEKLASKYKNLDIELQYGGQDVYYYILSVE